MAAGGDYTRNRRWYQDASTTLAFTASTDDTTLITCRNVNHTIYVQRIIVWIKTSTTATMAFEDTTTGKQIAKIPASPGADTRWDFDFGPEGVPLTVGENFEMDVSATGLAGHLIVEAYQKRTVVSHSLSGASLQ